MKNDVRWVQRFSNYKKALVQLRHAVRLATERELSDLEKQGLVQAFEFTHELAWNTMKDFYEDQGTIGLQGSRDVVRTAFRRGLIAEGDIWMSMIESRNLTSHTYDEATVQAIVDVVCSRYANQFEELAQKLESYVDNE